MVCRKADVNEEQYINNILIHTHNSFIGVLCVYLKRYLVVQMEKLFYTLPDSRERRKIGMQTEKK